MSDPADFFAALDAVGTEAASPPAAGDEGSPGDQSSLPGSPPSADTAETAKSAAQPFDYDQFTRATSSAVAAALAEVESRRGGQPRPAAAQPKRERKPFPEPDKDKLLADEGYLSGWLKQVVETAEHNYGSELGEIRGQLAASQALLGHIWKPAARAAYDDAARLAVRRGLVADAGQFEQLGESIGQIVSSAVQSGRADALAWLNPETLYQAAEYAVHSLGKKPAPSKRKAPEHQLDAGDAGGETREPKVNDKIWGDVSKRLSHLREGLKIPEARKQQHAREMRRRVA